MTRDHFSSPGVLTIAASGETVAAVHGYATAAGLDLSSALAALLAAGLAATQPKEQPMPEFTDPITEAQGFITDYLLGEETLAVLRRDAASRSLPAYEVADASMALETDRAARIMRALLELIHAEGLARSGDMADLEALLAKYPTNPQETK